MRRTSAFSIGLRVFFIGLLLLAGLAGGVRAATTASAQFADIDLGGGVFKYTVTLTNTGTTNIETFWFSWVPGQDFMAVSPTNIVSPTGWNPAITGGGGGDGFAIQWTTSSAPLAPSGQLTFVFESTSTPAAIGGNSVPHPGTPVGTSFVYSGAPLTGTSDQFVVTPVVKVPAKVVLSNLTATYDTNPHAVTVTTTPAGLSTSVTYNGSATAPTAAGSYAVVATIVDPTHMGNAKGTLVISKATATVVLSGLNDVYTGVGQAAMATTTTLGLTVNFTYNRKTTLPVNVGSYAVVGTVSDPNYVGSAKGTLAIGKAVATVTFGSLAFHYNGTAHPAVSTTSPVGLLVTYTYNGKATVPVALGSYTVVGTIKSTNYTGSNTGMETITLAPPVVYLGAADAEVSYWVGPVAAAATVSFEYSTNMNFTTSTTTTVQNLAKGTIPIDVLALLSGLTPNTVYFYRIVTTTAGVPVNGPTETFTTLGFDTTLVAKTGDFAVGSSGPTFASFNSPAVNASDAVAFAATLSTGTAMGITAANDFGIWTDAGGTRELVAQTGGNAPTANGTFVFGVSGNNVTGYYFDSSGVAHGFLYNGSAFTTIDPPGTTLTEALGVSGNNVVGFFDNTAHVPHGFFYNGTSYTAINGPSGSTSASAQGVSGSNVVGSYIDRNSKIHGFLSSGMSFTTIDPPGTLETVAEGVSGNNVVGFYVNSSSVQQGFIYNGGTYTSIPIPGNGKSGKATGVDGNDVVGFYTDSSSVAHGFHVNGNSFTTIDPPGTIGTEPSCVSGLIIGGTYFDSSAVAHGFTFDGIGYTTIDPPGTTGTSVTGVSGNNVVGSYVDENNVSHGYLYNGITYTTLDPPGASATFLMLSDPVYNNNAAVAFLGTLKVAPQQATATTAMGIFSDSGGSLAQVARLGFVAPATNGGKFSALTALGLSDSAGAIMAGTITGTGITTANNAGVWEGNSSNDLQLMLRTGEVTDKSKTIASFKFLPTEMVVNGQTRGFGPTTGHLVANATYTGIEGSGIVKVVTAVTPLAVATVGDAAAGTTGATFATFSSPAINDGDHVAFLATLKAAVGDTTTKNAGGIWADDSTGTRHLVARLGSIAPGTMTNATFLTVGDPVYNANEAVAFRGTLSVGTGLATANNMGIFAEDNTGAVQLIVRTGNVLTGKTTTALTFLAPETTTNAVVGGQGRSFSPSTGDLVYHATFSDKSQAIFNVVFP